MKIIIPARRGSKGLPGKNRILFSSTAEIIPLELIKDSYVLTDDPKIKKMSSEYGINSIDRPDETATDSASMKSSMIWLIDHLKSKGELNQSDDILLLYLTYPERTWIDVKRAIDFYLERGATSLLCKKPAPVSPFLMLMENGDHGVQPFYHDLYRRQDYPKCFELSHYICMFNSDQINSLNNNLYSSQTVFMPIPSAIDVDTQKDLDQYYGIYR